MSRRMVVETLTWSGAAVGSMKFSFMNYFSSDRKPRTSPIILFDLDRSEIGVQRKQEPQGHICIWVTSHGRDALRKRLQQDRSGQEQVRQISKMLNVEM